MHNIDRTQAEQEMEYAEMSELELEADEADFPDDEMEFEEDLHIEGDYEMEEQLEFGELEGRPFDEATEMELAAELLEVGSDEEMEQFLGKLFRRAVRGIRRFARSKVGRRLGGFLKGIARKALPIAGRVAGSFFGGPVGGAIGGRIGSAASRMFEMELEGMSPEDQEYEVARRFVRLAGSAAQEAARAARRAPPTAAAKAGLLAAARRHAPGLSRGISRGGLVAVSRAIGGRTGRWVRRGRAIVLLGV